MTSPAVNTKAIAMNPLSPGLPGEREQNAIAKVDRRRWFAAPEGELVIPAVPFRGDESEKSFEQVFWLGTDLWPPSHAW